MVNYEIDSSGQTQKKQEDNVVVICQKDNEKNYFAVYLKSKDKKRLIRRYSKGFGYKRTIAKIHASAVIFCIKKIVDFENKENPPFIQICPDPGKGRLKEELIFYFKDLFEYMNVSPLKNKRCFADTIASKIRKLNINKMVNDEKIEFLKKINKKLL